MTDLISAINQTDAINKINFASEQIKKYETIDMIIECNASAIKFIIYEPIQKFTIDTFYIRYNYNLERLQKFISQININALRFTNKSYDQHKISPIFSNMQRINLLEIYEDFYDLFDIKIKSLQVIFYRIDLGYDYDVVANINNAIKQAKYYKLQHVTLKCNMLCSSREYFIKVLKQYTEESDIQLYIYDNIMMLEF